MSKFAERIALLLTERLNHIVLLEENLRDETKDKDGTASSSVAGSLRFIGVAEYLVNGDIIQFNSQLKRASDIEYNLFLRYDSGEPIAESYVSMLAYKSIFDALAACEFDLAKNFAMVIGGRDKMEKYFDHPFDYAMGYTLKSIVLQDVEMMDKWSRDFTMVSTKKGNSNFSGYASMFIAIKDKDNNKAREALDEIVKGHIKLSKGRGVFKDTEDELLCVWGLGIVNLARYLGLDVPAHPPLIPDDLIYKS